MKVVFLPVVITPKTLTLTTLFNALVGMMMVSLSETLGVKTGVKTDTSDLKKMMLPNVEPTAPQLMDLLAKMMDRKHKKLVECAEC